MAEQAPGRACPLSYRYPASALAAAPSLGADSLWIAGGLYGNPFALRTLEALYDREPGPKALVFNGDFHWFDVDPEIFAAVDAAVLGHVALRGNVETELAEPAAGAGCGCAYPAWVDDGTVGRSNRIIDRLRTTAGALAGAKGRLRALPMHTVAAVGGERVAIVHGDARSLAGWGFSQEALATAQGIEAARADFADAGATVFASSHSCLPVLQALPGGRAIANNGAAGLPNFSGTRFGVATRISVRPRAGALYAVRAGALWVEAVALEYDAQAWEECFLAQWPPGSDAHRSYYGRIARGPGYSPGQALRGATKLAA